MRNQFALLKQRRFLPLFVTQFLGAFNDNVYKNAVIILIGFSTISSNHDTSILINVAGALFILPYLLFSAPFGQLADRIDKSRLLRLAKLLEIVITVLATIAFILHSYILLLIGLFLLGTQSTLFGPAKYSILPQHLKSYELIGGNALIETATFIAILTGSIFGGYLIATRPYGMTIVSITIILIALLGYSTSRFIPPAPSKDPTLKIDWNIFRSTWQNIQLARKNRAVILAIFGISWFWFYGAFMLYQVPNYTKIYLGGNAYVATTLLAIFSIGIGTGSLLCEIISRRVIELALVPIGAVMISVFTADLYFLQPTAATIHNLGVIQFLQSGRHIALMVNLFFIGVAAGFFTVPLYALVQDRSDPACRSRIIASVNIFNALFMIVAAFYASSLISLGVSIPQLMLLTAVLNACVTIYIFSVSLEYIIRLIVFFMVNVMYRLKVRGIDNLNIEGPVIYACNHVSFVDVLVMTAASRRPIRFLMDHQLFKVPFLHTISRIGGAIPICSEKENPAMKRLALHRANQALKAGEVVGIFPEGFITRDGTIGTMQRGGLETLLDKTPVPVVPMAVYGLWGSFFSRKHGGKAMTKITFPKRFWSKLCLEIGPAIAPEEFTIERLQHDIEALYKKAEDEV